MECHFSSLKWGVILTFHLPLRQASCVAVECVEYVLQVSFVKICKFLKKKCPEWNKSGTSKFIRSGVEWSATLFSRTDSEWNAALFFPSRVLSSGRNFFQISLYVDSISWKENILKLNHSENVLFCKVESRYTWNLKHVSGSKLDALPYCLLYFFLVESLVLALNDKKRFRKLKKHRLKNLKSFWENGKHPQIEKTTA